MASRSAFRRQVPRFWIDQKTASFPNGAPDRAEYNTDWAHTVATRRYDDEWRKTYRCMAKPCTNTECPEHGR